MIEFCLWCLTFFVSFQVTILDNYHTGSRQNLFFIWVLLCVIRLLCWETLLSHQEQAKGSYPVLVIWCVIWCLDCKSVFTQEDRNGIISCMFLYCLRRGYKTICNTKSRKVLMGSLVLFCGYNRTNSCHIALGVGKVTTSCIVHLMSLQATRY